MSKVSVFKNNEIGEIRAIQINDEPWFIARDVLNVLEIINVTQAMNQLDEDEKLTHVLYKGGQNRQSFLINESGLYKLIIRSNKNKQLSSNLIKNMRLELATVLQLLKDFDVDDVPSDRYVYVAKEEISGRYKIGISKDPERRVKQLNTGNPEKLILVASHKVTHKGYLSEKRAHKALAENNMRGEWFDEEANINKVEEVV